MITNEDAKKLDRIKQLEYNLSFTRFAIPLGFIFAGFISLLDFIRGGKWKQPFGYGYFNLVTFSLSIIAPIIGLIFFAVELKIRREAKEELILLKWELGLK